MEYLSRKRDEVSRIIQKHIFPQKFQLNVEKKLQKPLEEEIKKESVKKGEIKKVTVCPSGSSDSNTFFSWFSFIRTLLRKTIRIKELI